MSNISSLCYNPTPENGATTEVNFPIADAEIRKTIYTDSSKTYIGLPATPAISINNDDNIISFRPFNNNTQVPLILQGNDSPLIPNDSTIKIINKENTDYTHYLVRNNYEDLLSDYLYFWDNSNTSSRYLCLGTYRKINGIIYSNDITLSVGEDGTRNIQLSDPTAWREAFEIKDLGLVEEASSGAQKSVSNNTVTNLCSKTFSAGTWLIHCTANFSSGNNLRHVYLASSTTATGDSIFSGAYEKANSGTNIINFTTIKAFDASTTKYLNVYQNSGSALNVHGGIQAVKICDFVV